MGSTEGTRTQNKRLVEDWLELEFGHLVAPRHDLQAGSSNFPQLWSTETSLDTRVAA